jgi:hypothetical protein
MTWNATSAWSLTPSCANCVAVNTSVAVTRYRYRGSIIPTPWTPNSAGLKVA